MRRAILRAVYLLRRADNLSVAAVTGRSGISQPRVSRIRDRIERGETDRGLRRLPRRFNPPIGPKPPRSPLAVRPPACPRDATQIGGHRFARRGRPYRGKIARPCRRSLFLGRFGVRGASKIQYRMYSFACNREILNVHDRVCSRIPALVSACDRYTMVLITMVLKVVTLETLGGSI